jgi:hypothetical protein
MIGIKFSTRFRQNKIFDFFNSVGGRNSRYFDHSKNSYLTAKTTYEPDSQYFFKQRKRLKILKVKIYLPGDPQHYFSTSEQGDTWVSNDT